MQEVIRIAVTGAAGQIGYSLLPRIATGEMFGKEQPVILQLLEIPPAMDALNGVAMELEDCAFPLLKEIVTSSNPDEAFAEAHLCLLVGSKPRGPGMERSDLLRENGRIFVGQGKSIDENVADNCRVVVVGNPCNTNCMIAAAQCSRLGDERFTAMVRLDQNRAEAMLAKKASVGITEVSDVVIYGNHSPTMYPDYENSKILGKSAMEIIGDENWMQKEFIPAVGQRGAEIIKARGLSSAASAANALINHVQDLDKPSDKINSMAVVSRGEYGFAKGVWTGMPTRTFTSGEYKIVNGMEHNSFAKDALERTNDELIKEREMVNEFL